MNKPQHFVALYTTRRNLPYQCVDHSSMGLSLTGGVLGKGTPVWMASLQAARAHTVPAWVEDIGVVSVDIRCLIANPQSAPQRMTQRR